jgi:hypothetical protein
MGRIREMMTRFKAAILLELTALALSACVYNDRRGRGYDRGYGYHHREYDRRDNDRRDNDHRDNDHRDNDRRGWRYR